MNPDQPSREQIEARITALLLGELAAEEAALLRYTIAQDPALKQLHDQLQSALPLVREAAKHPADAPAEKPAPLKLSADRREKLLAHFNAPRPQAPPEPLFWLKRIETRSLVQLAVVVAIIGLLASLAVPGLKEIGRRRGFVAETSSIKGSGQEDVLSPTTPPAATAPAPPTIVTVAPTSQPVAPPTVPPVQIVLPAAQPESGQLADNNSSVQGNGAVQSRVTGLLSPEEITSKITAPQTASVYSQHIVGYENHFLGGQGGQTISATTALATKPPALPSAAPAEATAGQFALNNKVVERPRTLRQGDAKLDKQWIVPSQATDSNGANASPASTDVWS
ncbi:MAG TPA: hypothetical protein VH251_00580, partial [Verrucomicrobiae bacterium]|nr:hypothetical protein [Verrucomicrobiae bacterium]